MGNFLRKIFRISFIMKTLTVLCLLALIFAYLSPYVHPETFWMIPFFGLAYPITISCTLILLVIWAIARSRWFFVVLFFILLGGKLHFRMISMPFGIENTTSPRKIKILSYNVRLFDVYNVFSSKDYSNRDSIFQFLSKEQADIVCLQEFYYQDNPTKFPTKDTLHALLKAPYLHDRMSFNKRFKNYFGVAMYSKYPMITRGHIDFDDSIKNSNNFCIFADIVKGKDTIRVYNTHFQSIKFQEDDYAIFGEDEIGGKNKSSFRNLFKKLYSAYKKRVYQAEKVIEHMQQSPHPVIICGDFNDTPMSYTYNLFYSKYVDAFRHSSSGLGVTYAGRVPAGRIDYMFHSDLLNSSNFKIQKQVFSDHKAITCDFWKK